MGAAPSTMDQSQAPMIKGQSQASMVKDQPCDNTCENCDPKNCTAPRDPVRGKIGIEFTCQISDYQPIRICVEGSALDVDRLIELADETFGKLGRGNEVYQDTIDRYRAMVLRGRAE